MPWGTKWKASISITLKEVAITNGSTGNKKAKKLSANELRKKKKDRMARRKRGEEVFSDED